MTQSSQELESPAIPGRFRGVAQQFGLGWCEPIEGTVSTEGCQLRTYVYRVVTDPNEPGSWQWAPCAPEDVVFGYSTNGVASTSDSETQDSRLHPMAIFTKSPIRVGDTIRMTIPMGGDATVRVYNIAGRRLRTLTPMPDGLGQRIVSWDGRDDKGHFLPSGVYLFRLSSNGRVSDRKCVFIR